MSETVQKIYKALRDKPDALLILDRTKLQFQEEKKRRQEFYNLVHEDLKAEFINGEIVFHSPVMKRHWVACSNLTAYLVIHVKQKMLGLVGNEKVMVEMSRNDYEPDIVFFRKEKAKAFSDDKLLFPPPDFVVEILSKSTAKRDRGVKMVDYAAHGVEEYWIIDPLKKTVEQYINRQNEFLLADSFKGSGVIRSKVVEGFEIEIARIFE